MGEYSLGSFEILSISCKVLFLTAERFFLLITIILFRPIVGYNSCMYKRCVSHMRGPDLNTNRTLICLNTRELVGLDVVITIVTTQIR